MGGADSLTTLRPAGVGDAEALAVLSTQLGYPVTTEQALARLGRLLSMPDHCVLVAEVGDSIAGWAHVEQRLNLESGDKAELMGLVVDASARGVGVGSKLVEAAEQWAAARGLGIMVVRSNVAREGSHAFYRKRGYSAVKSQHVYQKSMNAHRT